MHVSRCFVERLLLLEMLKQTRFHVFPDFRKFPRLEFLEIWRITLTIPIAILLVAFQVKMVKILPIKVIVIGAVHIAQYLVDFAKSLNFEIYIIDPRGYFASEQRFPEMKIINKWPNEAFNEIETNENTALIALTHDPKIDDPALQHALNKKFYYIGALGSKKTHENRCQRLKEAGFSNDQINSIHGPIGIKLGGRSAPEIALSIIAQLVSETYKK